MSDQEIREKARRFFELRGDQELEAWARAAERDGREGVMRFRSEVERLGCWGDLARFFWRSAMLRVHPLSVYQLGPEGVGLIPGDVTEWVSAAGLTRRRFRVLEVTEREREEGPPTCLCGHLREDHRGAFGGALAGFECSACSCIDFQRVRSGKPGGSVKLMCIEIRREREPEGIETRVGRVQIGNRGAAWMGALVEPFDPRKRRALLEPPVRVSARRRDARGRVRELLEATWACGASEDETRAFLSANLPRYFGYNTLAFWCEARDFTGWTVTRRKMSEQLRESKRRAEAGPLEGEALPLFDKPRLR